VVKRLLTVLLFLSLPAFAQLRPVGVYALDGSDGTGLGSVTSVGNGTVGSLFSASWATATTTPAFSLDFAAQAANCIVAGPASGANAVPTCRVPVALDLGTTLAPTFASVNTALLNPTGNVVEQYNGTNPQRLSVYGTYTSATNFERMSLDFATTPGVFHLTTKYGTAGGSPRPMVFGGGAVTSDVAPQYRSMQGQSAWSQATVNTAGASLNLAGGLGRRFYSILLNTGLATKTFTVTANGTAYTLTAVVSGAGAHQFNVGSDDTAAQTLVTANNLAAAIVAETTLTGLVTPTVVAGVSPITNVFLDKQPSLNVLTIATNAGGTVATATSGADGAVSIPTVIQIGRSDTGISRGSAGAIYIGNGTVGDYSGSIVITTFNNGAGTVSLGGTAGSEIKIGNASNISWTDAGSYGGNPNLWVGSGGAANLRLGAVNSATPVAQTLSTQGVVAGTADTAGAAFTLAGSVSTGAGAGGPIVVRTAYPGAASTVQNTLSTRAFAPSQWTTLTETTATPFATLTFGASSVSGAKFWVTIEANDGTDYQSMSYEV
jgi:hypothetical protein